MRKPLLIRGQWGLGDNIYARPFIRALAAQRDLYLETPWPELFEDLPVRFVLAERPPKLRTQLRNIAMQPASRWSRPPAGAETVQIGYWSADLRRQGIFATLAAQFARLGAEPAPLDLPPLPSLPLAHIGVDARPLAVVRPVTVRREWCNEARNPRPEYVAAVARELSATHRVVAIADLEQGEEWALPPLPPAEIGLLAGQLPVRALLALIKSADVAVGGVGWIVPAAVALGARAFIVLGGHGAHNAPDKILEPRMGDLSRIGFAKPQRYCQCTDMRHACDKTIADLMEQWCRFAARTRLHCASALAAAALPGGPSLALASTP
jgi:hypothetical protein